jgi:tetratricopeptide (TPR) repeat protein
LAANDGVNYEKRVPRCYLSNKLFCLLFAAAIFLAGCTNPEKAKAQHVTKGEAYLKDSKFQEASLEFRNAIQIDDNSAAAHWGLARAYEGLERFPEMLDELRKTVSLGQTISTPASSSATTISPAARGRADIIGEAERLAKEVLAKDPNNIEGHILMGSVLFARIRRTKPLKN